jgi:hypothetical protein
MVKITITPKNIVEMFSKAQKILDKNKYQDKGRMLSLVTNYGIVRVDIDKKRFYGHPKGVVYAKRILRGAFDNP